LEAGEDAGLLDLRPGAVQQVHRGADLVVGAGVGAEAGRVALVGLARAGHEGLGAQHVEAAVGVAQLEAQFVARAEEVLHRRDAAAEDLPYAVVHIAGAEAFGPADAQAADVHHRWMREAGRIERVAQRVGGRCASRRRELQAGVGHGAAHGPDDRNRRPAQHLARAGHHAW
jgi:hypothetical protein